MEIAVYTYRVPGEDLTLVDTAEMTPTLVANIARWNGHMTVDQVSEALELGLRIYTYLHIYAGVRHKEVSQ